MPPSVEQIEAERPYLLRFALAPIFYWLPAWLAVCLVYGFMQARQQGGGWLRWSARFLRRSWAWQGRGDTLFWLALMPWLATLGFGATGVVELSTPWAIPIGYAFSLRPASSVHTLSARFVRPL